MGIEIGGGNLNVGTAYLAELDRQRAQNMQLLQMRQQYALEQQRLAAGQNDSHDKALMAAGQNKAQIDATRLQTEAADRRQAAQLAQSASEHGDSVAARRQQIEAQQQQHQDAITSRNQQIADQIQARKEAQAAALQQKKDAIDATNQGKKDRLAEVLKNKADDRQGKREAVAAAEAFQARRDAYDPKNGFNFTPEQAEEYVRQRTVDAVKTHDIAQSATTPQSESLEWQSPDANEAPKPEQDPFEFPTTAAKHDSSGDDPFSDPVFKEEQAAPDVPPPNLSDDSNAAMPWDDDKAPDAGDTPSDDELAVFANNKRLAQLNQDRESSGEDAPPDTYTPPRMDVDSADAPPQASDDLTFSETPTMDAPADYSHPLQAPKLEPFRDPIYNMPPMQRMVVNGARAASNALDSLANIDTSENQIKFPKAEEPQASEWSQPMGPPGQNSATPEQSMPWDDAPTTGESVFPGTPTNDEEPAPKTTPTAAGAEPTNVPKPPPKSLSQQVRDKIAAANQNSTARQRMAAQQAEAAARDSRHAQDVALRERAVALKEQKAEHPHADTLNRVAAEIQLNGLDPRQYIDYEIAKAKGIPPKDAATNPYFRDELANYQPKTDLTGNVTETPVQQWMKLHHESKDDGKALALLQMKAAIAQGQQPQQQQNGPVRVTTQAAYDALPPGAHYTDSSGHSKVKGVR